MAIVLDASPYELAHGRSPKGEGNWTFDIEHYSREAGYCQTKVTRYKAPSAITFREACALARKYTRDNLRCADARLYALA